MKKPTNHDGFLRVLAYFHTREEPIGAMTAMASALGVTRAAVSVWSKSPDGIPTKHIAKLKKLTGLKGRDMLPELAALLD